MRRIRIERKSEARWMRDRDVVLPLDARDPAVLRAKQLLRERSDATVRNAAGAP